ncbi:hypothetical protein ACFQ9X_25300 [Catenulispora yoronensis]
MAEPPSREDLPATAADPRFEPLVRKWAVLAEKRGEAAALWAAPALRPFLTPPEDAENDEASHVMDGPAVHSAVHAFGHRVGHMSVAPQRPLYEIQRLSQALRAGEVGLEQRVRGLGLSALLVGRLEWVVLRAITPSTSEERRELLTAFLEVWAESAFADADVRAALDKAGIAEKFPFEGDDSLRWDTRDRIRRLVALLRERGAAPHGPANAVPLMEQAGLSRPGAEFALAGLIGVTSYHVPLLSTEERRSLGLSTKQVEDARSEVASVSKEARPTLLLGVLPEDPEELWRPGGLAAVAERIAANWAARFGKKTVIPEATLAAAPDFGRSFPAQALCVALAEPASSPILTRDIDSWLVPGVDDGVAWYGSDGYRVGEFNVWLSKLATATAWAYAALPSEDPVRRGVPEMIRLVRQRLLRPELILVAGQCRYGTSVDDLAQRFGPSAYQGPIELPDTTYDDGLTISASRGSSTRLYFRPALLGRDARTATLDSAAFHGRGTLDAVSFLLGSACDRLVERIESGGLPAGTYEADPRVSAPDLVAAVADRFELDSGAAAYYLQLLAVPQPTDAWVRVWNGWRPAHHKAAIAALAERGLVVQEKRPKAGRGVFLPGPWSKAANFPGARPVEAWKKEALGAVGADPALVEWARVPLTELFQAVVDRVLGGDGPAHSG